MRSWEAWLKKRGITLVDETRLILKCDQCGQIWSPEIREGGKLRRGYWKCPNGCNWRL